MGRKKKLKKGMNSLQKQIEKHERKIKEYKGKDYTLGDYWKEEITSMKKEKAKKQKQLDRKKK